MTYRTVTSRGVTGRGFVRVERGPIVLEGIDAWPDREVNVRTALVDQHGR